MVKPIKKTTPNIIKVKIDKIVYQGSGIGNFDGIKVFVPYSAPDDLIQAKVTQKKKNYWLAEIKKILEPSSLRTIPPCIYFTQCGGCDLQHIKYRFQLELKKEFAIESLQRICHLKLPTSPEIIPAKPFRYRNKTQYPLASNPLRIGFYKQLTHNVIDIDKCLLHPNVFDDVRQMVREQIIKVKEPIYNEIRHFGNLRHIIIRQGMNTDEMLLIFVTRTDNISKKLYESLVNKFSNIVGIIQNINPAKTNRILGNKNKVLFGRDYYFEKLLDKQFKVSGDAFFQVNTYQAENLVKKLREYLGTAEQVLDLYCGVGVLSIMISDLAKKIYGVEISAQAIQDANENIKINQIHNIEYFSAPVEKMINKFQNIDTVILDPPRKGCAESVLLDIIKLKPKKIIYISCNPTTFARDLTLLLKHNYHLEKYELIDMFAQTYHVESIAKIVSDRV
ncbi:MAG: 23S rRNA (uracil(1939)-C(5))-methyltransferase RlmD [candidate division WOR-3 bacterium]